MREALVQVREPAAEYLKNDWWRREGYRVVVEFSENKDGSYCTGEKCQFYYTTLSLRGILMKLKNNRGITLIELNYQYSFDFYCGILFLFRLLVDVRYSDNHSDFDRANQQTRAIIIKTIQQDFLERKLIGLTDQNTSLGSDQLVIDFSYGDGTNGTLRVSTDSNSNEQYLSYRKCQWNREMVARKENSSTKIQNKLCFLYD